MVNIHVNLRVGSFKSLKSDNDYMYEDLTPQIIFSLPDDKVWIVFAESQSSWALSPKQVLPTSCADEPAKTHTYKSSLACIFRK